MKNFKKLFAMLTLLTTLFQGCGSDSSPPKTYSTALGEGVSMVSSDNDSSMAPHPLTSKAIGENIAAILKADLMKLNNKEALSFSKETNYCDISGLIELENSGTLQKIITNKSYKLCKNDQNSQDGSIRVNYNLADDEGKYPKNIDLLVRENYTFNTITLQKDTKIQSSITYNKDKSLKSISFILTGVIEYNYGTYTLKSLKTNINF